MTWLAGDSRIVNHYGSRRYVLCLHIIAFDYQVGGFSFLKGFKVNDYIEEIPINTL